ncbi:transposase [Chamaesiphon sp.]|uniref:transposase n=1 Tax=Chamaesiphon sp. TaxID=2814140 RepID=UPI003594474C
MATPQLYHQLFEQLGQWIIPKDLRHLKNCAEIVAAILESESACLAHWIPYLSHRDCQARSHLERLSYFMNNPAISDRVLYVPLLKQFLKEWTGQELILVMDTSMFWDTYCLIEVCIAWGGRSITLAQTVIEHGSSTVGFEQYKPVLEAAKSRLPIGSQPTLLADRGFEHSELMRWLTQERWNWGIRVKSNLQITLANGKTQSLKELFPPKDQVYLFPGVKVLGDVECNLGTANCRGVKEPWAVLTNTPLSLQIFQLYGKRFGGVEPRFKDYKSGTFDILRSKIRDPKALSNLLMMIEIAEILAIRLGLIMIETRSRSKIDWHGERGLSLLQLGIRTVKTLGHQALPIPFLTPIPWVKISPACASLKKRAKLARRIEFSKVISFSY